MPDIKESIAEVITRPQLGTLATITEDGRPWVRYVFVVGSDDLTMRFASVVSARKVKQIEKNNEVHITCGVASLDDMQNYVQIQGKAKVTTDQAEKDAFWNPGLEQIFDGPQDPNYSVIIVEPYRIELCKPGSHTPDVWEA
jgi:general stress protein 26